MHGFKAYEQFLTLSNQKAEVLGSGSGPKKKMTYIPRQREEAEQRLLDEYFGDENAPPKYPEENFRQMYRANNNLNVLYGSPLFDDVLADRAPEAPFVVNGKTYNKGYYLADGEGDITTMKFIQADVECSSSPIFTSNDICPRGHIISPLNPTKGVFAGINWFLISGRNLLKQCSYKISEEKPPSTYMRCTQYPPISVSMIMGPSVPSSSPRVGKEIIDSGEKVCVILCLAIIFHGCTINIASGLSFPEVSPFLLSLPGLFHGFALIP
nr:hypothetical protein [Tanacetum cinerariifolium]